MRIAMVGELVEAGGRHVAELAAALTAQGHDVTVYCRRADPAAPREVVAEPGYRVLPVLAESGDQVTVDWGRDRPDVVHTHSWATAPAALAAAAGQRIPTVHTFRPHPGPSRWVDLAHVLTSSTDRVTTTCSAHVDALVGAEVPRAHISVVPDGVDMDLFTPEGPAEPTRTRHRLVALGDQAPHGGFSTAVAALRALPDTELVVPHEPTDDLRLYGAELGVADRLRFTGPLPPAELAALLRSADVAVCTPWHEPCRPAVLEAMACGVAVVATTVGPLPDIVVEGVTGLLVPPRRPRSLADALHRLLAKPVTCEQYGAAGRDRVEARYSWQRIASEIIRVYQQAGVPTAASTTAPHLSQNRRGTPIGARQ
jgi:D-inositol-3-phosphate glycosyltransferase